MKLFHMTVILSLSVLMAGCAAISVDYNYDASFDFSNLSSYNWLEMPMDFPIDHYSAQHIKTAVDRQMKEKGFRLMTGNPDFIISLQGQKDTVRQSPQSTSTSRVTGERKASEQFQHGTFTMTMIDAETDRLIWEGYAKGVIPPNLSMKDKIKKTNEVIADLLADFPPSY